MKKVIEGWVGKDETLDDIPIEHYHDIITIRNIYNDGDFDDDHLPPKKVTITVEIDE